MDRRSLLQTLAMRPIAIASGAFARKQDRLPTVTVDGLEIFRVKVNRRGNWTIARLQTSGGITGLGDASQSGKDDQTLVYLKPFADLLKGRSIFDVEWLRKAAAPAIAQYGTPAAVAASALD